MGAGASGKDYAKTILTKFGFRPDVSYTTRMPRIGETNGQDYIFITETEMLGKVKRGDFIQWNQMANGSCYGTTIKEWNEKNVFIMTPNVLNVVKKYYEDNDLSEDFLVIRFDIDEQIRFERMVKSRKFTEDEASARIEMDKVLFEVNDYHPDITITNPSFNDIEILNSIFSNNEYNTEKLKDSMHKKAD